MIWTIRRSDLCAINGVHETAQECSQTFAELHIECDHRLRARVRSPSQLQTILEESRIGLYPGEVRGVGIIVNIEIPQGTGFDGLSSVMLYTI